jgi:hypothetical protein
MPDCGRRGRVLVREGASGMRIGFIGAGDVTKVMGRHLLNAGHTIAVCSSRGPRRSPDSSRSSGRALARKPRTGWCGIFRPLGGYLAAEPGPGGRLHHYQLARFAGSGATGLGFPHDMLPSDYIIRNVMAGELKIETRRRHPGPVCSCSRARRADCYASGSRTRCHCQVSLYCWTFTIASPSKSHMCAKTASSFFPAFVVPT